MPQDIPRTLEDAADPGRAQTHCPADAEHSGTPGGILV